MQCAIKDGIPDVRKGMGIRCKSLRSKFRMAFRRNCGSEKQLNTYDLKKNLRIVRSMGLKIHTLRKIKSNILGCLATN